jgi:hypothetical protein
VRWCAECRCGEASDNIGRVMPQLIGDINGAARDCTTGSMQGSINWKNCLKHVPVGDAVEVRGIDTVKSIRKDVPCMGRRDIWEEIYVCD